MRIRQHPAASAELDAAITWYHERNPAAAQALWREVRAACALIEGLPHAAPKVDARARRLMLHGFPYAVVYSVSGDDILILAYAHERRRPGYWRGRWVAVR